ncbi:pyruvate formate lyase family protein [Petroclostridium xylanilyticum]|uniref:pyruvate formate lyase family protein n=1 Tax=Petroclostridium xylanilyticum TaxID=1792311 RepID=UPI000B999FB3|nr:pyruvate formate lyase family protein [Petroclostridium xylanilyticum]
MDYLKELEYAVEFTELYKNCLSMPKELREVKCLEMQIEHVLQPIQEKDLVAGFMKHGFVGFSPQYGGIYTYYFHKEQVQKALGALGGSITSDFATQVQEMIDFWEEEQTMSKLNKRFKDTHGFILPQAYTQPGLANAFARIAGTNVDLDKLIRLGIPGLREEIQKARKQKDNAFYEALERSLDLLCKACDIYIRNAKELLQEETRTKRRKELCEMIYILENIKMQKPASFKEGVQLFWIYAVVSDLMNYGRMDVYLGDLYCNDIDNGVISEEEAIEYLSSLWRHFVRIGKVHDCRVIVGGVGRRNEEKADRLALTIMEVSRRVKEVVPQLTLRYYKGMNEQLLDTALQIIGEGYCYPIIYSDETNVPAIMKAYEVSREEAERYVPFGCGEYVLEGLSTGTPNNGINLLKALELVLHDGYDRVWNMQLEEPFGGIEKLDTFDKLFEQYCVYVERNVRLLAEQMKMNYDVAGEEAGYLFISLLMDDCIKRGCPLLDGGVRYLNAASEVFGMISCADSLSAIKKLVYDEKKFTLQQVVEMLDANFEGYERERKLFKKAPKYGNDDEYADNMAQKVFNHIAEATMREGKRVGLNKYLMVSVNNSMSAEWGVYCLASACGRKYKDPMANGNGASIGADQNGLTSLLNSMSKFNNTKHVGVINNIKLTKKMFKNSYEKLKNVVVTFFNHNGVQLNFSCVGKDDLENAMKEPDKYRNLIVRIGGFSARFVELNPVVQNEIIRRTTYEG